MEKSYDVIIIGAGPGGLAAAYRLHPEKKVLVVENDLFGGTCPNRGCDPKKMLYSAVEAKQWSQQLSGFGLKNTPEIDWTELMAFKRQYTQAIPAGTKAGLKSAGIDYVQGTAQFIDAHHLQINDKTVTTEQAIIATGRKPTIPDIPGKTYFKTSTDFLDLDQLPKKIVFIGAGFVAIELANIAIEAGSQVTIVQHNQRVLKAFPKPLVSRLVKQLQAKGVHFQLDTSVTQLTTDKDQKSYQVQTNRGNFEADYVVAATGREANIEALRLPTVVKADGKGIQVNNYLQTDVANIYAIGDVVVKTQPKLTPVASFEGNYVADYLLGQTKTSIQYPVIPNIVFANSELGQVGIRYQDAVDNDSYTINDLDMTQWYTYNRVKDPDAHVITIQESNTKKYVGFCVLATQAESMLNALTTILNQQLTLEDIQRTIYAYPSDQSDLQYILS
ncbi:NAD(P)/FAD-dependent oxidoreductase [Lactobacillus sp. CC-MHH1034]|uniref:dihydrolipoyl dehydrogenase family protein n=1 Tax=Agrilactobacillus fermenti TaxID=2586909 RepID=UPI001E2BBB8B|nr:NAD(P)/FAD-dependent oxidoreductase [Agrilactobacillus fermenti]MCD2255269.1 NAD(P)/FAD-dependent oxidoreductase [Agrilactobacillus fermenti]